jgi:hypothetical protein
LPGAIRNAILIGGRIQIVWLVVEDEIDRGIARHVERRNQDILKAANRAELRPAETGSFDSSRWLARAG